MGCDGSGGNGGDGIGVVGRLTVPASFVEESTGRGEDGGGAGEFGRDVGAGEAETLPVGG